MQTINKSWLQKIGILKPEVELEFVMESLQFSSGGNAKHKDVKGQKIFIEPDFRLTLMKQASLSSSTKLEVIDGDDGMLFNFPCQPPPLGRARKADGKDFG